MYTLDDGRQQGAPGWGKLPFFWFILFLSYECTRRCDYCYSFNQMESGNKIEMDERTFSRLLEWIPEVWKVNNVKVNYVGFLGGEPLLRTDRIKKIMDTVYRETDGMQGALNTNADLVDTVNWDDLEDINWISINVTDIGIEELARRMKIIAERSNAFGQTITVTLDEYNLGRILDITRFGVENGYRLRYQKNIFKVDDAAYFKALLRRYHDICDLLEDYILRGYDVNTTFLLDTLVSAWDFDLSPYPCGKRLATVFPDGSVGPCIRDHSFKTGTIFDENPMGIIACDTFHYGVEREAIPEECRQCEVKNVCQGGCPHDKLLLKGTVATKSASCEIHREIIPRLKKLDRMISEARQR